METNHYKTMEKFLKKSKKCISIKTQEKLFPGSHERIWRHSWRKSGNKIMDEVLNLIECEKCLGEYLAEVLTWFQNKIFFRNYWKLLRKLLEEFLTESLPELRKNFLNFWRNLRTDFLVPIHARFSWRTVYEVFGGAP